MLKTNNIKGLSFIRWTDLKLLFISPYEEDFNSANDILEQFDVDAEKLEYLIDELNAEYKNWQFYLESCRIRRAKVRREEEYGRWENCYNAAI